MVRDAEHETSVPAQAPRQDELNLARPEGKIAVVACSERGWIFR